jgi:ribonuclease HI
VPPLGSLKINIDGVCFATSGKAALGAIICDHEGNLVLIAWRLLFNCRDAEEAEMLACLDGIRLANRWPDCAVVLESDCAALVTKLNSSLQDCSIVAGLISDIKYEISQKQD